jgi:hypothetical protein
VYALLRAARFGSVLRLRRRISSSLSRSAVLYLFKIDLYFFGFDDIMAYMAAKKAKKKNSTKKPSPA